MQENLMVFEENEMIFVKKSDGLYMNNWRFRFFCKNF